MDISLIITLDRERQKRCDCVNNWLNTFGGQWNFFLTWITLVVLPQSWEQCAQIHCEVEDNSVKVVIALMPNTVSGVLTLIDRWSARGTQLLLSAACNYGLCVLETNSYSWKLCSLIFVCFCKLILHSYLYLNKHQCKNDFWKDSKSKLAMETVTMRSKINMKGRISCKQCFIYWHTLRIIKHCFRAMHLYGMRIDRFAEV